MNKFQEALDNYVIFATNGVKITINNHYKDTLQELIDKYSKLEKALDITIDLIYGEKGSFIIPHNKKAYKEWVLKESEKNNDK